VAARSKEFIPSIVASSKEENPEFSVRACLRARGDVRIRLHGAPTILQRIVACDPVWKFDWPVIVIQKALTQVFCDVTLCR
jgi:hypothetical protein